MAPGSWEFEKTEDGPASEPDSASAPPASPAPFAPPSMVEPVGPATGNDAPTGSDTATPPSAWDPPVGPPAVPPTASIDPTNPLATATSTFGPAPVQPPARYRPDTTSSSGVGLGPQPLGPPPAGEQRDEAASAPLMETTPGWGWRAFAAFLAGGLLTGGGFAIGNLSTDNPAEVVAVGPVDSTPTQVTAPSSVSPPSSLPPPDPSAAPAAFVASVLGPSVVQIETDFGIGSGVIYGDGLILTNHHVIDEAVDISVLLSDGRKLEGEILGSDAATDIGVVSIGEGQGLPTATLATGENAQVGQVAIAIGSPFRLQQTVTEGIVSAVNRPVPNGNVYTAMIQTDAPINPGNSGGALADRTGRVLGINTAIQTGGTTNTNAGVGFAIPIDTAISVADRIVAGIPIEAGLLGVRGNEAPDGSAGVHIIEVTPDTGAEAAGLLVGDRIVAIDGAPVTQFEELAGLVVANVPGAVVQLDVVRDGVNLTLEATLGAKP